MTEPTPLEECSRIVSLVYDDELAPDTALVVLGKQLDRVRAEAKREERERIRAARYKRDRGPNGTDPFAYYLIPAEVLDAD